MSIMHFLGCYKLKFILNLIRYVKNSEDVYSQLLLSDHLNLRSSFERKLCNRISVIHCWFYLMALELVSNDTYLVMNCSSE